MHDGVVVQHHALRCAAGARRVYDAGRVLAAPASGLGGNVERSRRLAGENVSATSGTSFIISVPIVRPAPGSGENAAAVDDGI